jgi:hypothetical protein
VEVTPVESLTRMSLKEENNLWKCQHLPMDKEQQNQEEKIFMKPMQHGMLFLNSNSKQARGIQCGIPQMEQLITLVLVTLKDMNSSLMSSKGS